MSRALADFVWSRGKKLLILFECFGFGIMSLFQIGKCGHNYQVDVNVSNNATCQELLSALLSLDLV